MGPSVGRSRSWVDYYFYHSQADKRPARFYKSGSLSSAATSRNVGPSPVLYLVRTSGIGLHLPAAGYREERLSAGDSGYCCAGRWAVPDHGPRQGRSENPGGLVLEAWSEHYVVPAALPDEEL